MRASQPSELTTIEGESCETLAPTTFVAGGQEVTVPVKNNVWAYEGQAPLFGSLTAHFRDGSTQTIG